MYMSTSIVPRVQRTENEDYESLGMISYRETISSQLRPIQEHWNKFGGDMRIITNRHNEEENSNWRGDIIEYKDQPWKILGFLSPEQEQYNEAEVYRSVTSGEAPYSWYLEYQYFAATSGNVDSMQQYIDGWLKPLKEQITNWKQPYESYVNFINTLDNNIIEEGEGKGEKNSSYQVHSSKEILYYHPNFENILPFHIILHILISRGNIEEVSQILDTKMKEIKQSHTSTFCDLSTGREKEKGYNIPSKEAKVNEDDRGNRRRETEQRTLLEEELEEDLDDGSYRSILLDSNSNLPDGTSPILTAILFEQIPMLQWLLKSLQSSRNFQKEDVYNSIDYFAGPGLSPLVMAAVLDNRTTKNIIPDSSSLSEAELPMVKLLLEVGGREQICSYRHRFTGASIFHFAAEMNRGDAISLLCREQFLSEGNLNSTLSSHSDIEQELGCDHLSKTQNIIPLHVAADVFTYSETAGVTSTASALVALLSHPCNSKEYINSLLLGDTTPLYLASQKGNLEAVQILISYGADVNYIMPMGTYSGALRKLGHTPRNLANFKTINSEVANGATALHAAAEEGHLDVVRTLLWEGKARFIPSMSGVNPLGLAVMYEHQDIIILMLSYLLEHYRSKEENIRALQNRTDITTEEIAKAFAQLKKIRRNIEKIVNNHEPSTNLTPFFDCILRNGPKRLRRQNKQGSENSEEFKLDRAIATFLKFQSITGINIADVVDKSGRTPLTVAISRSDFSLVKGLLYYGCDVNSDFLLHSRNQSNKRESVTAKRVKSIFGEVKAPVVLALEMNKKEIAQLLMEHGARVTEEQRKELLSSKTF